MKKHEETRIEVAELLRTLLREFSACCRRLHATDAEVLRRACDTRDITGDDIAAAASVDLRRPPAAAFSALHLGDLSRARDALGGYQCPEAYLVRGRVESILGNDLAAMRLLADAARAAKDTWPRERGLAAAYKAQGLASIGSRRLGFEPGAACRPAPLPGDLGHDATMVAVHRQACTLDHIARREYAEARPLCTPSSAALSRAVCSSALGIDPLADLRDAERHTLGIAWPFDRARAGFTLATFLEHLGHGKAALRLEDWAARQDIPVSTRAALRALAARTLEACANAGGLVAT